DRRLSRAEEFSHGELARVTEAFWICIVEAQALAVLILTPALVAGAVAGERERGNLELLVASPLSSLAIIVGKLAARLSHLVVMIAVALPVLGLLSWNGGVDVRLLVLSDAVLLATGYLIGATAMAVSTLCTRPRQAISSTYGIVAAWMALPFLIDGAR